MSTTPTAALTLGEHNSRPQSVVEEGTATGDKAVLEPSALDSGSNEEDGAALADQLALVKLAPTTADPESSGNLFDRLPFEVIEVIFGLVHQDWQQMPSPAQLLLVSRGWKALASSMPTIWQDTSLLRVPHNISTPLTWRYSSFRQDSRRNNPQVAFLHRVADLSRHTLRHFELEAHVWSDRDEELQAILGVLLKSRTSLRSLALLTTSTSESYVWRKQCTSRCDLLPLDIVMQCPKVTDVQLSLSDQIFTRPTSMTPRPWESKPSFLRLRLDCWGGHPDRQDSDGGARYGFLHRASRLRTLTLYNLWGLGSWPTRFGEARRNLPFILDLIARCAKTLEELKVTGCFTELLPELKRCRQVKSFPQMRRLRYVQTRCETHAPPEYNFFQDFFGDVQRPEPRVIRFPSLETIEAPVDVILAVECVPSHIILRLDDPAKSDGDCNTFLAWLRDLRADAQRIHSLTLRFGCCTQAAIDRFIEALRPSVNAGAILCPHLTKLSITVDTATRIMGELDDEWFEPARMNVIGLLAMEEERRSLSRGRPLVDGDELETSPVCKAMTSIEIVGCYIGPETWARMKMSACEFNITPLPDLRG